MRVVAGFALFMLAVFAAYPASSADFQITTSGIDGTVGDQFQVGTRILAAGAEGPGDVSLTITWGTERSSPYWLGAVVLESLPTVLNPNLSVSTGSDCLASVGADSGRCSMTFTFDQPTVDGVNALASFDFIYQWLLAPGYEFCFDSADPTCIVAGQSVHMIFESSVFAGPNVPAVLVVGTFGAPRVRPIPEPTTATLTAIGIALMGLAGRRDGPPGSR